MEVPYGYCKCGCGQLTQINAEHYRSRGWVKGEPRDYLRGHQSRSPSREASLWERIDKRTTDECWPWVGMTSSGRMGYGRFKFWGRAVPAHRAVWEVAHGEIPEGLLVCHRCDNPPCCNPAHLFLGTQVDNLADRRRKGRDPDMRGSRNGGARLTAEQIREIRHLAAEGVPQKLIAAQFAVSASNISLIVARKAWAHI